MRSGKQVAEVLALVEAGLNDCEIERRTGIPRRTVLDWRHGSVPRSDRRTLGSDACPRCGHDVHDFETLPSAAYAYLLGMYLGDGCISAGQRGVYALRIVLDRKYPNIVRECATAMGAVMPTSKIGIYRHRHQNVDQVGSYSRAWPCLLPQHGPGQKHLRSIELLDWQRELVGEELRRLLRGLIHSDGCRSVNTIKHPRKTYVYPRYQFANLSADIKGIFCWACDELEIEWRVMNPSTISVARRESVALMDTFIGSKT